jgi:hypothetical protein
LTFGQSAQYKRCGKYSNLAPCKFSHFSEAPKYFSYFYSLLLIYSIGKGFKMEKIVAGRFLCGQPSSAPNPAHLRARASLPPISCAAVAGRQGPTVRAVFPQSPPLLHACVSLPADFPSSSWPHIDCLHHPTVHLSTSRHEPSHRLLMPWSITSSLAAGLLPPVAALARMPPPAAR